MAADSKAKYEVQVDIDVKTGKVDVTTPLKELEAKLAKALGDLKTQTVKLPVDFDLAGEEKKIRDAYASVSKAITKAANKTSKELKSGKGFAEALHLQFKEAGDNFLADGKIAKDKLERALKALSPANLKSKVTDGRNPLNQFLRLEGKGLDEALSTLKNFSRDRTKILNNLATQGKAAEGLKSKALKTLNEQTKLGIKRDTEALQLSVAKREALKKEIALRKQLLVSTRPARSEQAKGFGQLSTSQKEIDLQNSILKAKERNARKDKSIFTANLGQISKVTKAVEGRSAAEQKAHKKRIADAVEFNGTLSKGGKLVNAMTLGLAKMANKGKSNKPLKGMVEAATKTAQAYERLFLAKSHLDATDRSGNAAERVSALKAVRSAQLGVIASIEREAAAAKKAGQSTKGFTNTLRQLNVAAKKSERELRGPAKAMVEFADSFRTFIRYAVAFRVLGGLTRGVTGLASSVVELDKALTSVKAISNATAEEMLSIENAVKNVATTTQFSTTEIAQSAQVLAQAGIGPESITATLAATANFASATNASLTVAADLISTIRNVYKDLDPEDISDKLTNAVNISKLTAGGLQTIFSRLAQTAKSFKLSFDQVLGAAAVLKNVGIKDSTISTGFRQGLLELLSPDAKTLKVLEKRYADVGETMSKSAISSMFSDFKSDKNPLLRVLNELEKLGIQGSGAQDFERVFDVRATNVIKALIDNKAQFVKNTEAIGKTGAAAKGAKTQIESLANAADNLVAVTSVLAADLSGGLVDGLKDVVDWATKATNALRDSITAQKQLTGSSGVGASVGLGVSVAGAVATKGLGAGKAAIAGAVTAAVASAINANAGKAQGVTAGLTEGISTLLGVVSTLGVVQAIFGKGKSFNKLKDLTKSGKAFSNSPVIQAIKSGSFSTAVGLFTSNLGKLLTSLPLRLGLVLAVVTSVSSVLADLLDSDSSADLEALASQREALGKELEDNKKALTEAVKAVKKARDKEGVPSKQGFGAVDVGVTNLAETVSSAVGSSLKQAEESVRVAFAKQAGGIKDKGSSAFKDVVDQISFDLGVRVSVKDAANLLIELDNKIAEAEGKRLLFVEQLVEAYATSAEPDSAEFIKSFESLSTEEQRVYKVKIDSSKEAEALLKALAGDNVGGVELTSALQQQAEAQKAFDDTNTRMINNTLDAIKVAQKSAGRSLFGATFDELLLRLSSPSDFFLDPVPLIDALDVGRQSVAEANKKSEEEANKASSQLAKAVEEGNVDFVRELASGLLAMQEITMQGALEAARNAVKNAEAVARKEIQGKINKLNLSAPGETTLTPLSQVDLSQTSAEPSTGVRATQARQQEEVSRNALKELYTLQLEAVGDQKASNDLKKQIQVEEAEYGALLKDIVKLTALEKEEALTVAEIRRGFLFETERIKQITKEISDTKSAELKDESKVAELLSERLSLEKTLLEKEKELLSTQITKELEAGGRSVPEGSSLEEVLSKIQSSGILVEGKFKKLAGLVSEALVVQDKLNNAEDTFTRDLDNLIRKGLTSKLSKSTQELTKQQTKTSKAESQLSSATGKLKSARDKLASALDKQAGDVRFFRDIDRSFKGEEATQRGDGRDLLTSARGAASTGESISLAKESISVTKQLLDDGKLTRSEAIRQKDNAKRVIEGARAVDVQRAQQEVQARSAEVEKFKVALSESVAAERALKDSVDKLKTAMDSIPEKIKEALAVQGGSDKSSSTEKAAGSLNQAAKGTGQSASALNQAAGSLTKAAEVLSRTPARGGASAPPSAIKTSQGGTSFSGGHVPSGSKAPGGSGGTVSSFDSGTYLKSLSAELRREPGAGDISSLVRAADESKALAGYSTGGLITGPGNGRDDKAGIFRLSDQEFVQPSEATNLYGKEFMEKIRNLSISPQAVRDLSASKVGSTTGGEFLGGAEVSSNAKGERAAFGTPVTFAFGGAKLDASAKGEDVGAFRQALSLQALKEGTRSAG